MKDAVVEKSAPRYIGLFRRGGPYRRLIPLLIVLTFHILLLFVFGGIYIYRLGKKEELFKVELTAPKHEPLKREEPETIEPPDLTQLNVKTLEKRSARTAEVDRIPDTLGEDLATMPEEFFGPESPEIERKGDTLTKLSITPLAIRRPMGLPGGKGSIYAGRGQRAQFARRYGGSAGSEKAVNKGLEYLARNQNENGSWDAGEYGNDNVAITGFALMAFLGAGHNMDPRDQYGKVVKKAIKFIEGCARKNGWLGGGGNMYCHAIGTFALSEAYSVAGARWVADTVQNAIGLILKAQEIRKAIPIHQGGWRYSSGSRDSDLSVSGWVIMAVVSSHRVGFEVPEEALANAALYVDGMHGGRGRFGYTAPGGGSIRLAAVGPLCLQFLGYMDEPATQAGLEYISNHSPAWAQGYYYWYYATQALFQKGGRRWQKWNKVMRDLLVDKQNEDGSWPDDTNYSKKAGKNYSTALGVLILEVYYRYLPIYGVSEYKAVESLEAVKAALQAIKEEEEVEKEVVK